jgi:uncharacterized protein (DUF1330 family)
MMKHGWTAGIAAMTGGALALLAATTAAPGPQEEQPAFLIVLGEVHDREAFLRNYAAKLPPLYEKYGGEYLAIGAGVVVLEGTHAPESFVIARWPSMEAAQAFWNSPEYDALRRARIEGEWGDFSVLLVPGLSTPRNDSPSLSAKKPQD